MQIYKGIVADTNKEKDTVIVFTMDGDIVEVKANGQTYRVGDEIYFFEKPQENKYWSRKRVFQYASGLAAGLLLYFSNPFSISDLGNLIKAKNDAYAASVFIESRSNVKVGVNKSNGVVSVQPLNDPAKIVLKNMNWNGEQLGDFLNDYFKTAQQTGYLGAEDKAIIAVDPASKSGSDSTTEVIQKDVEQNSFVKANNIQVFTVTVPDIVVEKAQAIGVTPGKFSLYLAATKSGVDMPLDMIKAVSVSDLVNAVPTVAQTLPSYSETQLAKLVQNNQPTVAVSANNTPQAGTSTSTQNTTNTQNTTDKGNATTSNSVAMTSSNTSTTTAGSSSRSATTTSSDSSKATGSSDSSKTTGSSDSSKTADSNNSSTTTDSSNNSTSNKSTTDNSNNNTKPSDSNNDSTTTNSANNSATQNSTNNSTAPASTNNTAGASSNSNTKTDDQPSDSETNDSTSNNSTTPDSNKNQTVPVPTSYTAQPDTGKNPNTYNELTISVKTPPITTL